MHLTSLARRSALAALLSLALPLAAWAQIKIGQTAGFSGPAAAGVKETTDGAKLYLDVVNANGGVFGQTIELISLDDGFDPKQAGENAKKLLAQDVLALFLTRGTPHTQAILPLLAETKTPLIAPSTGAMVLHNPVNPWVFNVRASYQREAEKAIQYLANIGVRRITLLHVDDSFGADAAVGALKGFDSVKLRPVAVLKYDRSKPELAPLIAQVIKGDAQAVLFIGTGSAVADGVAQLRAAGSTAQVATLSNNAASGFVKSLKDNARGVIVTQVFPYERSLASPLVRQAQELAKAKGLPELTPANLEGFAAAKVLVEGLKRAGKNPNRFALQRALESFKGVDIGGLEVSFSATDHTGLDYADLSIIGPDGKFWR
jgi:branched-chain amino acid transport system substrate-binding protein